MARARSPNRDKAFEIYKNNNGYIKLIDIAKELNIKDSQVRKWKSQDNWDENIKGALPINKGNVTNRNKNKVNVKVVSKGFVEHEVTAVLENAELTDKQRLFCIYYVRCFNATKAYQKAYECSYNTALVNGSRLLGNARIKEEVQSLKEGKLNRAMLTTEDIFQRYIDIAFGDIGDYLTFSKKRKNCWTKDDDGNDIPVVDPDTGEQKYIEYNAVELNDSINLDTSILQEVSEGKDGVKIRLQDKMRALQWLADHMDIATDKQKAEIERIKAQTNKLTGDNQEIEDTSDIESEIYGN